MIALDYAGTRKLQLITTQNGADVIAAFSDFDTTTKAYDRGVPQCTTISSATTTDVVATPASGKIRDVDFLNVKNTYAGSNTVTLQVASASGGPFVLVSCALLTNETLRYVHGLGIQVLDASGQLKITVTGTAGNFAVGGSLSVGTLCDLSAAAAGQIKFPATQNASTDVNTLDDYDEYVSASTACTGALTVSVAWKLTKTGKSVVLTCPAAVGTTTNEAAIYYGLTIPAKYRPAQTIGINIPVMINGGGVAQPGLLSVTSGGGIQIYRDGTQALGWGTAANSGMLMVGTISWMI